MSTAGVRSKTGGVVLMTGGTITSASFSLTESGTGKSLQFTTITLPGTATMTSGANSMTLSNFTSDPPNTVLGTGRTVVTGRRHPDGRPEPGARKLFRQL